MNTTINKKQAITDFLNTLGIKALITFLPRECKEEEFYTNTVQWNVHLTCNKKFMTTNYFYGIGHLPGCNSMESVTVEVFEKVKSFIETGFYFGRKAPVPELVDVMYCLVMDYSLVVDQTFEDYCSNLGFNSDSINDKAIYDKCLDNAKNLENLLGKENLKKLDEMYQDY